MFSRSTERECLLFRGLILFEIVTLLLSDLNNVHIKYPLTWNQLMAFSSLGYFGLFFTSVLFWFEEIYVKNGEVIRWLHERSV